ncbi:acetamidase [Patellaria atrata CBS 101060]|uniref:amidase n=1 Tax=Patellaria atrata CBS 101060 TaxID=1346257 RepID=A0A9P4SK49_9PEZI|nr:acetamidase [Patellaria atrata CBS 101060]
MSGTWEPISRRKKEEQLARIPQQWLLPSNFTPTDNVLKIPRECGLLSGEELGITENYDATALGEAIATRKFKCVVVARAFSKRAAIAHQLTNCLTEIFFDDALKRAAELDAHLDAGKPPLSPLHGVPVSLKDTFCVPGYDASVGLAALCFKPSTNPSTLVQVLLNAGAVLYCKTNIPQTLMALDSHNNIFGRTLNPRNRKLTAGGSSGGEGALIAMRGSILGVGTDIGGSIRIPSMCNGLYGIKPSWQRIPYMGQESGKALCVSDLSVFSSAGPMSLSLRDCELFMRTILTQKPWEIDSNVAPGNWNQTDFSSCPDSAFTIGIVHTDGITTPLPPIAALINEVASTLFRKGIKTINLNITSILSKTQPLANAMFAVEGENFTFDLLESHSEPLSPWLRNMKRRPKASLDTLQDLHVRRSALETEFLRVWNGEFSGGRRVDALILPVAPHPVPEIDNWGGVGYTSSWALLDCPAGVIPVRSFGPADLQGEIPDNKPIGGWDKRNRELWTKADRKVYLDTPLCIQVVAPKLQEKRLYRAMEIIERALKAKGTGCKYLVVK